VTRTVPRRAAVVLAPLVAGLLLVACGGGGGGSSEKGYVQPKGAAQETIAISAKNFSFTPDTIPAKSGIAELELTSTGGLHDLVFDDAYPGFQLEAQTGETDAKKIDLKPGKYTFYCSLPGHRQAGMEGTLTVK
jgi:plastocyanin